MSEEIRAKIGTKLTDEEKRSVDSKSIADLQAQPEQSPVEGQMWYRAVQVCPHCGCVGYGTESTDVYRTFRCHCCGNLFRA
jgi:Rieske Fe-S protein